MIGSSLSTEKPVPLLGFYYYESLLKLRRTSFLKLLYSYHLFCTYQGSEAMSYTWVTKVEFVILFDYQNNLLDIQIILDTIA